MWTALEKLENFLYLKTEKGRVTQIRDVQRLECFSRVALCRLQGRIEGQIFCDYRKEVFQLIQRTDLRIHDNDGQIRIHSPKSQAIFASLDRARLEAKLDLSVQLTHDTIEIACGNHVLLSRFFLFLLCDYLDLSVPVVLVESTDRILEKCRRWFEKNFWEKPQMNQYIFSDLSAEELNRCLSICGVREQDNRWYPEPYRTDLAILSDLYNDLQSAKISFICGGEIEYVYPIAKNRYELAQFLQVVLNSMGFCYVELPSGTQNKQDHLNLITEFDKKARNRKYPHLFYSFMSDESGCVDSISVWQSGMKFDLNLFAEKMKIASNMLFGENILWNGTGEILRGKLGELTAVEVRQKQDNTYRVGNHECVIAYAEFFIP